MAIHTPITLGNADEVFRRTPLAAAFAAFLPTLAAFIAAERDLEDVDGFDPAYHTWLRDAERAQDTLIDATRELHHIGAQAASDLVLKRMIRVIDLMRGTDDPVEFRRTHRHMHAAFFGFFQVKGFSANAIDTNALILCARHLVDAMSALPLFHREEAIDTAPDDFWDPASPLL